MAVKELIEKDDRMQNEIHRTTAHNEHGMKKVQSITQSIGKSSMHDSSATGLRALSNVNSNATQNLKELKNQKIQSFEEAFSKIMNATGISDLDLLVKTFIQGEEKNFALFKFVNELNSEIENYETQIFEM